MATTSARPQSAGEVDRPTPDDRAPDGLTPDDRAPDDRASDQTSRSADRLASQVAHRIEAEVILRGWPVGEALDSEPVLRERYGVSRNVLREAVRLVEHHQVAEMRRGPGGGLIVCAPDVGPATRAAVTYLEYARADAHDLLHVRRLIEPIAAMLTAERLTEAGITTLRRALAMEEAAAELQRTWADNPMHVILSDLTGNPVLQLFVDILNQLNLRYVRQSSQKNETEMRRLQHDSHRWHTEIIEAVIAGDGPRAQVRLLEHLDDVSTWMETNPPGRRPGTPPSAFAPIPDAGPGVKLAEVVAARIYQDITEQGQVIGSVLGSQAELMDRYGASRAVLRAAVRLLEHHSVARSRRGPGGGLIVTRPEPQATIDTTALYLAFRGATPEDLRCVRDALELGVVDRLVAQRTEPDVARRLRLLSEGPAHDDGTGGDPGRFHAELAELTRNPILNLFVRIIGDLTHRTGAAWERPDAAGTRGDEVRQIHLQILTAIRDGDIGLAQHRMRRHLGMS